jgi:hypothetical protein
MILRIAGCDDRSETDRSKNDRRLNDRRLRDCLALFLDIGFASSKSSTEKKLEAEDEMKRLTDSTIAAKRVPKYFSGEPGIRPEFAHVQGESPCR